MNSIDLAIIAIIFLFSALGVYWGLIRQVLSLVGLLAGVVVATRYGVDVADGVAAFVDSDTLANWLGFILVLVAVNAMASLLATLLRRYIGLLLVNWLDHLAGGLLGFVQAALTCTVLLASAAAYPYPWWIEPLRMSRFATGLLRAFSIVFALLPASFRLSAALTFGL